MTIGWKILAAILLVVALVGGYKALEHHIYESGRHDQKQEDDLAFAKASQAAQAQLDAANDKIRNLSRQMTRQLDQIAEIDEKEKEDAKAHEDALRAQLRNGDVRLRLAVGRCEAGHDSANPGAGTAGGTESQASAELLPATADRLFELAFDADREVRRTNECVDRYNAVKAAIDAQQGISP